MASDGSCHGQGGSNNRPHLLVFDRAKAGNPTQLRGHTHGIQFVAWFPRGSLLVSIGESETNHFEQQVCLWSWPQGERLASTLSVSGIVDVTVAPDAFCFVTLTAKEARCWSVLHHAGEFGAGRSKSAVQMAGRPLPIELPLHPGAELEGSKNHRHMQEDFVSAAFGAAFALYLITSQGRLMATNVAEEGLHADRHMDLGRKAHAIVWAERLCGEKPSPCGLLVCGLEYGTVEIIDAEHLRTYAMLTIDSAGALESVGVSYSISGEALWVLFSDRSLARWRRLSGKPDRALLSPLPELQECLYTPGCCSPRLVTRSLGSLQSWTVGPDDIKLQPQEAWKVKSHQLMGPSSDMTAFTCSQGIAATGHCNGEVQLLSLPSLAVLGPMPCKHSSDVHAMSFCPWRPLAGVQLLLATASRDGSTMVFRIDVNHADSAAIESAQGTLLMQLPCHSSPIQGIALLGGNMGGSMSDNTLCLAVYTADRNLLVRDMELGPHNTNVRRCYRHPNRSSRWVGLCAHPAKAVFFAAQTDRRILQLDCLGRTQQQIRTGGPEVEVAGPLRLNSDARCLAVGLCGRGNLNPGQSMFCPGVLLLEVDPHLRPVLRLVGHSESVSSFTFLPGDRILGCWKDGVMHVWDTRVLRDAQQFSVDQHRDEGKTCGSSCQRARGAASSSPSRTRVTGKGSPSQARRGTASLSPQRMTNLATAPVPGSTRVARLRGHRSSRPDLHRDHRGSRAESFRGTDSMLKRLLASSPKPPKWAGSSVDSSMGSGVLTTSMTAECSIAGVARRHGTLLMGKWARGSRVGEQVLSASDLHAVAHLGDEPPPTATVVAWSEGRGGGLAASSSTRSLDLFVHDDRGCLPGCSRGNGFEKRHGSTGHSAARSASCGPDLSTLRRLPPKPCFPPPTAAQPLNSSKYAALESRESLAGNNLRSSDKASRALDQVFGQCVQMAPVYEGTAAQGELKDSMGAAPAVLGVATPCRVGMLSLPVPGGGRRTGTPRPSVSSHTTEHATALAADLRLRQKAPVLEELALMLLKESVPPGSDGGGYAEAGLAHLETEHPPVDTFVTPRLESGEVARFRAEVQRLRTDADRTLGCRANASKVSTLLSYVESYVETLLHAESQNHS